MDKKEFALNAILPYFKDPSTCGYEGSSCVYLTKEGKMCVAGSFMIKPIEFAINIDTHIKKEGEENVFRSEAVGILSPDEWQNLQRIHDGIAHRFFKNAHDEPYYTKEIKQQIIDLGLFTYDELEAAAKN